MTKMQTMSSVNSSRPKRCTVRCLFGAPDPLEIEKAYEEAVMTSADNFLKKWNFNVFTMQPCSQSGGTHWEEVKSVEEEVEAEDRLAAVINSSTSPEGRMQDTNAEVNTCRRIEQVRYNPYNRQQKLSDYWRTTKAPSRTLLNSLQPKKV